MGNRWIEGLEARLFMSVTGNVIRETWTGVSGSSVATIPLGTAPTRTTVLTSLETPQNDGSNYGDRIRGTITAPTSGSYRFFISGDDSSELWLSTTADPANKTRVAYFNGYTGARSWTKYSTQRSAAITLTAGQEYYFEVLHKQGGGATNLAVGWSKPGQSSTTPSEIIGAAVLGQYPQSQTPQPPGPPLPPVTGNVVREKWTGIGGNAISSIPTGTTPSSTSLLTSLEAPSNDGSSYGERIRGLVTAPTSGNYTFWIAGDDNSELYLSSSTDPAGKQRIAYFSGYTASRQWTKYATQKSAAMTLEGGKQYYFEILHKQGTGGANLAVGWAKPGQSTGAPSEIIPSAMLSQYVPPAPEPPGPVPQTPPTFSQSATPNLSIVIGAGTVQGPNGPIAVQGQTLTFASPELATHTYTGPVPNNYTNQQFGQMWSNVISPAPPVDTLLLGGLFKAIVPSSIVVKNNAGTKTYVKDVDYKINPDWGQVANINNRLGSPGSADLKVTYQYVKQRLDLVQVNAQGVLSIKKGSSAVVVPALPTADAGNVALAGIYVYTLDGARTSGFAIRSSDIFPITPRPPVAPINPGAIPNTLAKLQSGGNVNIAFFGDSITLGAEAGNWWEDRSLTYTGRIMSTLKARYGSATITETAAYRGSLTASESAAQQMFTDSVLNAPNKVDLVMIALGMNDSSTGPFATAINSYISQARAAGIEVMLISPMQSNPWLEATSSRATKAQISQTLRDIANQQNVAMADVHTAWQDQAYAGIAPHSQIHNWINHPGSAGMKLYADTVLRFF